MTDSGLSKSEILFLMDEWIFSERDRKILKRRWFDGICYEPLAEEFDMSERQVRNIVNRCDAILRKHIGR